MPTKVPAKYGEPFDHKWTLNETTRCWEWTRGTGSHGYGDHCYKGKPILAHRFAWLCANGPIPAGMCVCHHCDNRLCVNPSHLFLGTDADNSRDCVAKSRQAKGTALPRSILTEQSVVDIKLLLRSGRPQKIVAAQFGVSVPTVSMIGSGKIWKHVKC